MIIINTITASLCSALLILSFLVFIHFIHPNFRSYTPLLILGRLFIELIASSIILLSLGAFINLSFRDNTRSYFIILILYIFIIYITGELIILNNHDDINKIIIPYIKFTSFFYILTGIDFIKWMKDKNYYN